MKTPKNIPSISPKILLALTLLFSGWTASGQSFSLSTNLWFTNNVESGLTLTYAGTNCLDVTRYKTFSVVATGSGTNVSTNLVVFTFKTSATATNWEILPSYALTGTVHGVSGFSFFTNLMAGDGVGYVKPYQIISSLTNRLTNIWVFGGLKMFPRN